MPLARQDLLIERQRRSRLQLAQHVEQGGNGEIVVARHRLIVKQNAHCGPHTGQWLARFNARWRQPLERASNSRSVLRSVSMPLSN